MARGTLFATLALTAGLLAGRVTLAETPAQTAALSEISTLTKEAAAAFESYSYRKAQTKLERALTVAQQAGLTHDRRLAEVQVMIGVAAVAGSNDLYRGLHGFVQALRLDPAASIPQQLITPQLTEMFAKAKQTVKEIGRPPTIQLAQSTKDASPTATVARSTASGLGHSPIDSAKRGYPIPVRVETGVDIQAQRVLLFYRPANTVQFLWLEMAKQGNVFRANMPAEVTSGRYIHYYIEAHDQRGRLAASFGSARSPTVIIIE